MGSCQACRATYVLHIQGSRHGRPMQKGNLDFEWQSRDNEEEEEEEQEDEEYITMIDILRRA